ncbi:MAG: hypothetical protein IH600_15830, partial [Bacteroidetes bacterium]|nr:hypothetical protein [Bacteroidota bacterium]
TSDLIDDYGQLFLFSEEEEKFDGLYAGLDDIRRRFGKHAITYGSVLEQRQDAGGRTQEAGGRTQEAGGRTQEAGGVVA